MTKKKKTYKAELWSIDVQCLDCGNRFDVMEEHIIFSSSFNPCELCGSHGDITARIDCPYCKTNIKIELYSW